MTKMRYTYLQNALVLADAGEVVFNVGSNDVITRIDLQVQATNGGTNNKHATIADVITAVDFMNGSEPVISLSGQELMGMCANRLGAMPDGVISETLSVVQSMKAHIDFGRWYGDEQVALDLSKFPQFQMRIRWNLAAVRAVGATGFLTTTGRLTVIAHVMEGVSNPTGYLALKRHALIATLAAGVAQFDLPVDKIIRAIGIRSLLDATGGLAGISNVALKLNNDAERPIDLATADFLSSIGAFGMQFHYKHTFHAQNADVLYTLLKYREACMVSSEDHLANAQYINTSIGEGALNLTTGTTGVALAVDHIIDAEVHGNLPFGTAYLGFGTYDNPDSWLQAPNYKAAKLELTMNAATAALSVILEQLETY